MTQLADLFKLSSYMLMVEQGYVTERKHNSLPLTIANYSKNAQYERVWNDVTLKCRGLIFNSETLEIVSRPFEKFWNWDQSEAPFPPSGPCLQMPKMDGSLGILWSYHDDDYRMGCVKGMTYYGIATRGSFHSEQAEWATSHFLYSGLYEDFVPQENKTYLMEIIYPDNRIVVDYGNHEGLTLIDVINNETGFADTDEFDNCNWPDKVVRRPLPGFDSGQTADIPDGDEGFVYLWPVRNFRTKMKAAQYVILHRLISNLNEKTIWEQLVAGRTLDDIKRDLPEEFHGFVDEKGGAILSNVTDIITRASTDFYDITAKHGGHSRKNFALAVADNPLRKYLFLMLDNRSIYEVALKDSRPKRVTDLTHEG